MTGYLITIDLSPGLLLNGRSERVSGENRDSLFGPGIWSASVIFVNFKTYSAHTGHSGQG